MKHLKLYESFREEDIIRICQKYEIENYTINEDGSIDVDEFVNLFRKGLSKLPLKFRRVARSFDCRFNKLTSLEGCPKYVGHFWCGYNEITTFEHFPISIVGEFSCASNPIWEIWNLFRDYSKIEFLNDCDAIREPEASSKKPIIILERLNYFLEEIGKKPVAEVEGYKCV